MILKILPFLPGLLCEKIIGEPIINNINKLIINKTGDSSNNAEKAAKISKTLFNKTSASLFFLKANFKKIYTYLI